MLVLTRKIDEQIVIGDDIKITLIRVRGNTVRLGIEAPRDVRIVRSEIEFSDKQLPEDDQLLAERQDAFAHPSIELTSSRPNKMADEDTGVNSDRRPTNRMKSIMDSTVYVGKVARDGSQPELKSAPLAGFVSIG